jgi:hypothetical protein
MSAYIMEEVVVNEVLLLTVQRSYSPIIVQLMNMIFLLFNISHQLEVLCVDIPFSQSGDP